MNTVMNIIGYVFIITGILFICFGVLGIYRFKDFYSRMLIASKIDTIGFITVMVGVVIKSGFTMFSLKVLLILVITIIINPVINNAIVRSAYYSEYRMERTKDQ